MSSTKPLTKFAAMDCRPKPNPKPMAPVSTVSAVRSTPAAFRPMRMESPIRKALANLPMPMRVDGAMLLSFFRRRSTQRLIQAATSTNSVRVNNSFSTDQTETRLRPVAMPMLSRPAMMGSSQPRYSAAIASQMKQREAGFPMLHPGFVAEAGGEQQHAETHDDVGADQVRRRLQDRDIHVRRHEIAGHDHEKQTDEDGQDRRRWPATQNSPRSAPVGAFVAARRRA